MRGSVHWGCDEARAALGGSGGHYGGNRSCQFAARAGKCFTKKGSGGHETSGKRMSRESACQENMQQLTQGIAPPTEAAASGGHYGGGNSCQLGTHAEKCWPTKGGGGHETPRKLPSGKRESADAGKYTTTPRKYEDKRANHAGKLAART